MQKDSQSAHEFMGQASLFQGLGQLLQSPDQFKYTLLEQEVDELPFGCGGLEKLVEGDQPSLV